MIYVIKSEAGPVKIGLGNNPVKRVCNLQVGCWDNLSLLTACESSGDASIERWLHAWCKDHHIRGEWFKPEGRVLEVIDAIRSGEINHYVTQREAATILWDKLRHPAIFQFDKGLAMRDLYSRMKALFGAYGSAKTA